jgi:hypothetical protein
MKQKAIDFLKNNFNLSEERVKKFETDTKRSMFRLATTDKETVKNSLSDLGEGIETNIKKGGIFVRKFMRTTGDNLQSFVADIGTNAEKLKLCTKMRTIAKKYGFSEVQAEELSFVYYELSNIPPPMEHASEDYLQEFFQSLYKVYERNISNGMSEKDAFALIANDMKNFV